MPDWLVLGQELWDDVERRNQLLIRRLAARHPHVRVLFAEQPLRARHVRAWRVPRPTQVAPNIWTVRPIRPLPGGARAQRASDRIEAAQLRRALRRVGIETPMLWSQDPRAATLVDHLPATRILYDLTDDWPAFETDPAARAEVQARVSSMCRRAELVLACSRPLADGARAWSDRVVYLPNGVDPPDADADAADETSGAKLPADLAALPAPRLGYVGTLHSARLDAALFARAAELRPSWSFVLLGPDELDPADRARLLALPNVHHLGVRPHAQVRAYMAGLDVGLLPHRVTDFTRSLDPLKLYEYLAAGRPVIATPVGNTADLRDHIAVAATAEELVAAAERQIAGDTPQRAATRRAAVANATWEHRAIEVEHALGLAPEATPIADRVDAVIVSFNTRDLLARCLDALLTQATAAHLHAIVVDNGSTDASPQLVRDRFPQVELVELGTNRGFAAANNAAFARCRGEFVLLVNSDAFLAPDALQELLAAARRHPRAGAIGPRLLNPDGTLQRSAWPFPHAGRLLLEAVALHRPLRRAGLLEDLGVWPHDKERSVDFLVGACLLLRAPALAAVGGFDESYWLYGEEADLQRRMADRGWEVLFTPAATATHVGGASSASSSARLRQFYGGQRRFVTKHGTPLAGPAARVALLVGSALRGRWSSARLALTLGRDRP